MAYTSEGCVLVCGILGYDLCLIFDTLSGPIVIGTVLRGGGFRGNFLEINLSPLTTAAAAVVVYI